MWAPRQTEEWLSGHTGRGITPRTAAWPSSRATVQFGVWQPVQSGFAVTVWEVSIKSVSGLPAWGRRFCPSSEPHGTSSILIIKTSNHINFFLVFWKASQQSSPILFFQPEKRRDMVRKLDRDTAIKLQVNLFFHILNSMSIGKEKGHFFSFFFLTLYFKRQDSMSCYDWASEVIHQVATSCKIHSFLILNFYLFSWIICTKQFHDRSFFQRIAIKQPKPKSPSVLSNIYLMC